MDNDYHTETETTDVRDEKIPKYLGKGQVSEQRSLDHLAAIQHRDRLRKAEAGLWKARNLLVILDEYLRPQDCDECIRASLLVEQVERVVDKAEGRIERFGRDHGNLFIAYLEATRKANGADTTAAGQFHDKHYLLLRGIIVTARNLFREIHEPGENSEQEAQDLSCALNEMVNNLDSALQEQGLSGGAA